MIVYTSPMTPTDQLGATAVMHGADQNDPNRSGRASDLDMPRRHWRNLAPRAPVLYFGTLASTL